MDAQDTRAAVLRVACFLPRSFKAPGQGQSPISLHPHLPLLHFLMMKAQVRWDVAEHIGMCRLLWYAYQSVCVEEGVYACECVHSPVCIHTMVRV